MPQTPHHLPEWNDPVAAQANQDRVTAHLTGVALPSRWKSHFLKALANAAEPDRALNNIERFLAAARAQAPAVLALWKEATFRTALCTVFSASQSIADLLCGTPTLAQWLWDERRWKKSYDVPALLADLGEPISRQAIGDAKARHGARIGFADLVADKPLAWVGRQISDLAEALLQAALRLGAQELGEENSNGKGIVVLGMGKLGGRELNYSSDIDLIFLSDPAAPPERHAFFSKLAPKLFSILTTPIDTEQLYRVDARLRPHGKSGPLVISIRGAVNYYESHGSSWELLSLIKARPVAGDRALGLRFLRQVSSLVYPRYPNRERIRSVQAIKRRIETETARKGQNLTQVKKGVGGIRDIEFMVQFLQMLHGSRVGKIVDSNSLRALDALERESYLTAEEAERSRQAYIFLRTVEHRLQLMHFFQTHLLPDSETELAALARRFGILAETPAQTVAAFQTRYRRHTRDARKILNAVFHNFLQTGSDDVDAITAAILDETYPHEALCEIMAGYRFAEPDRAAHNFELLTQEATRLATGSSRRTRHYLAAIASTLLTRLSRSPDPDRALINLVRCTERYGARATFYQLLAEQPEALSLFVDLCGSSQFLSDILAANPAQLDPVIDALVTGVEKPTAQLCGELLDTINLLGEQGPALRDHYDREMLRIGIRDIQNKTNVRNVMDEISDLAESVVVALYETMQSTEHRLPPGCELGIVALGSLGSREMVYSSDLDLMFLFAADDSLSSGDAVQACSAFAQQIIAGCSGTGTGQVLYKVDTRLRPAGRAGMLATSVAMFGRYLADTAQLWEFMALTKARPIAGNESLQAAVADDIVCALQLAHHRFDVVDEVMRMRDKVVAAAEPLDIKRAAGGLVDIEFAVQMAQLVHGADHPSVLKTNTIDAILELGSNGVLTDLQIGRMLTAYEFFRFLEDRLRIVHNLGGDTVPSEPAERTALARRMGYEPGGVSEVAQDFMDELQYHRSLAQTTLQEIAQQCR